MRSYNIAVLPAEVLMRIYAFPQLLAACLLMVGISSRVSAQELDWAQKMFSELKVDFGNVASGSDTRHQIEVKNIYKEQVRILNVGTTCGCTAANPSQKLLETGETAYIEVVMNTVKFKQQKNSNVDVTLSFTDASGATTSKTVRVPISAYIRQDIVVEPGNVDFGAVDAGAGARRTVRVAYSGRTDWHINGVQVNSDYLEAEVREQQRSAGFNGDSRINYELIVQVKPSAPVGVIRDKINLLTDDAANPMVPVMIEAKVEPDIVVSPGTLLLGDKVIPGSDRPYTVIIKGKKPFAIERIECESDQECFKVRLTKDQRTVHVLQLSFTPPEIPGHFREQFTVTIDGRPEPVTFTAEGEIVAPLTSASKTE
ncbi:MAG: DUF1573 domain-containing protein [Planctomycetaceae bacterium]|nr:DUF1573 domain-containing protein [Planctomycetaceae bacterium]